MAKAGYWVGTSSAVALSAATAKTALMVITPSTFGGDLKKFRVSFDGVTASAVPVLCEIWGPRRSPPPGSTPLPSWVSVRAPGLWPRPAPTLPTSPGLGSVRGW